MLGVAAAIALVFVGVFVTALGQRAFPVGLDLRIYTEAADRLFGGGAWFLPRQLEGPYPIQHGDILYPPAFAVFVAPWLWLPTWTYVAIPLAIVAWHVVDSRPAPWTWPIIAFGLLYPVTLMYVAFANPSVQMMLFVTLALRWAWTGGFVLLKPSLMPFALVGMRDIRWWIGAALMVAVSLLFFGDTIRYPSVLLDTIGGGLLYSAHSIPMLLVPLVAWFGRTNPA